MAKSLAEWLSLRGRRRRVWLAAGVVALLIVAPLVALMGYGLVRGRDLGAFWSARFGSTPISGAPVRLPAAPYGPPKFVGHLRAPVLDEVSGLAPSRLRDDVLWTHNDSGSPPLLHALDLAGRNLGAVRVDVPAYDWEDLASFELEGEAYLLIGDTGDNLEWRRTVTLHVVREPRLEGGRVPEALVLQPAWTIRLSYEDGPRDCEAIAVEPARQRVLLMSKRKRPPVLYAVALRPQSSPAVARRLGEAATIPLPTPQEVEDYGELGRHLAQPSSLDVTPDGSVLIVGTYKDIYRYRRQRSESWETALARAPQRVALPFLRQCEAVTLARDGRTLFATTEQRPAPLFRIDPS